MAEKPLSEDPTINDEREPSSRSSPLRTEDILIPLARSLDHDAPAVMLADPQGSITYINQSLSTLSGFKPEDMVGRPMTSFWVQPKETTQRMMAQLYSDRSWRGELQHKKKRGQAFWELALIAVILNEEGMVSGFVKWGLDISDKKGEQGTSLLREDNTGAILDLIGGGFIEMDLRGTITYANEGAAQIYRRTPKDMRNLNLKDYMSADEADRVSKFFNDMYRNGSISKKTITYDVIGKDGTIVTCESVVSPLNDNKGQPIGFGSVIRDVTETKRIENALKESEESYRRLVNMAPYSITINQADGTYVQVNNAFCRRTGYSREEVIGRTARELEIYASTEDERRLDETFRRQGRLDNIEMRIKTKDGSITETLLSGRPIVFQGEPCNLFISTNIDDLKRAQRELMESEESFRRIIETSPYSIIITRLKDLTYLQVNDAFCERTGYSREETIGKTGIDQNIYPDQTELERMLDILLHEGKVVGFEMQFRAKDGHILESLTSITPIRFKGDDCFLTIAADLSERKRVERELEQYRLHLEEMVQERTRELEAAQIELVKREKLSVLGQLTATVSHELRNPLGVIRSSSFYIQRRLKEMDEKIDKHFKRIEEQVRICDAIVADLLEYTRGRNVSIATEDLTLWLEEVMGQIQESESITISRNLSEILPAVPHDQEKMRRVIINVVHNAVQAVREKEQVSRGIEDRYEPMIAITTEKRNGYVIIEIMDNGIGMSEETRERAFEPLFTTRARGTGIGLANVSKIIAEHGGKVFLESRLGEGTKVTIALPCNP